MLPAEELNIFLDEDLSPFDMDAKDNEDYLETYGLSLSFKNQADQPVGELVIHFRVSGYGIEGFEGGITTYYTIPFFQSGEDDTDFMEDAEAFQYIFSNFGEQIQNVVDQIEEVLHSHYEDGTPLTSIF